MKKLNDFSITKSFLILIFLFAFARSSQAQNAVIDSLQILIKNSKSDTERINRSNQMVQKMAEVNLDSAIALGTNIVLEARQLKYKKGEIDALRNIATNFMRKGEFEKAKLNLNDAKAIMLSMNDSTALVNITGAYGMMYGMQGKYDSASAYYKKAIDLAKLTGNDQNLGRYYGNIAIGYQMQSNYPQALFYQQKSLDFAEKQKNISSQAYTTLNMGITYTKLGDIPRAEKTLLKAVDLAKQASTKIVEVYSYSNLASLYTDSQDWDKTHRYAMKAVKLANELGDISIEASSYSKAARALGNLQQFAEAKALIQKGKANAEASGQPIIICQLNSALGHILMLQGNYKEAIQYYENCLGVFEESDEYDESLAAIYSELATCYENTGTYKKALSNFRVYATIKDSIRSRENIQKTTELTMNYEFEKKQTLVKLEQDAKDAEVNRIKNRQLYLIIALGSIVLSVLIIALILFRNNKQKQKANVVLRRQKQKVEMALTKLKSAQTQLIHSEKMASLGELTAGIAHEIQNPLNFVNNFSEVSNELIDEMNEELDKGDIEEAKAISVDIKLNLEKINHHGKRADGIVKGMLQHSRASTIEKEATDINKLADEYLRLAYHGLRAKDKSFNAELVTDFDKSLASMHVIPQDMGRVILNLLTNAFYAVNEKKKSGIKDYDPTVTISTKKKKNSIVITVNDNGNGIPEGVKEKIFQPFFTTKPTGQGTGLGLSMSYDIIKAHGGELIVDTTAGEGTVFSIQLPL